VTSVKATVHGAISIVNAVATGKGATLGISLKVEATATTSPGRGIIIESDNRSLSSRLINQTVEKILSKKILDKTRIHILLKSNIPTGYGLKSSSAISSSVALACTKLFKPKVIDNQVLLAGVDASIETKVSITGAYDDACACYYGGFMVTDNYKRKIIHYEKASSKLIAAIFIPRSRKRGNVKKLKNLDMVFSQAWNYAKNSDFWNAMILNGFATSSVLKSDPRIISSLITKGALGASVSGNGPSIAAVTTRENLSKIKKVLSTFEGKVIVADINNKKAEVHEL